MIYVLILFGIIGAQVAGFLFWLGHEIVKAEQERYRLMTTDAIGDRGATPSNPSAIRAVPFPLSVAYRRSRGTTPFRALII
jgi:hypothetical protein